MARVTNCASLGDLSDDVMRNALTYVPGICNLLCFELTSLRFKALVDEHLKKAQYVDFSLPALFWRPSPEERETRKKVGDQIRTMLTTRFSGSLKEIKFEDNINWLQHQLPSHHPQLFTMQLLRLFDTMCAQTMGDTKDVLGQLLFGSECRTVQSRKLLVISSCSVRDPLSVLMRYLNSLQDKLIVENIKSDLSTVETLELHGCALLVGDIKNWFQNVKRVKLCLRRKVPADYGTDVEPLAKDMMADIGMYWKRPDETDLEAFSMEICITEVIDASELSRLRSARELKSSSFSSSIFGIVHARNWFKRKQPFKDISVSLEAEHAQYFKDMVSGHSGHKISDIVTRSTTFSELETVLGHIMATCPNLTKLTVCDAINASLTPASIKSQLLDLITLSGNKFEHLHLYVTLDLDIVDAILEHCRSLRSLTVYLLCLDDAFKDKRIWNKLQLMMKLNEAFIGIRTSATTAIKTRLRRTQIHVTYCNHQLHYSEFE
ncbi:hypothetical protein HDE_12732 [Halotydeus destructor]|nr:hypothetical protein HDE_12732 [Halotydeus destructor]